MYVCTLSGWCNPGTRRWAYIVDPLQRANSVVPPSMHRRGGYISMVYSFGRNEPRDSLALRFIFLPQLSHRGETAG